MRFGIIFNIVLMNILKIEDKEALILIPKTFYVNIQPKDKMNCRQDWTFKEKRMKRYLHRILFI